MAQKIAIIATLPRLNHTAAWTVDTAARAPTPPRASTAFLVANVPRKRDANALVVPRRCGHDPRAHPVHTGTKNRCRVDYSKNQRSIPIPRRNKMRRRRPAFAHDPRELCRARRTKPASCRWPDARQNQSRAAGVASDGGSRVHLDPNFVVSFSRTASWRVEYYPVQYSKCSGQWTCGTTGVGLPPAWLGPTRARLAEGPV